MKCSIIVGIRVAPNCKMQNHLSGSCGELTSQQMDFIIPTYFGQDTPSLLTKYNDLLYFWVPCCDCNFSCIFTLMVTDGSPNGTAPTSIVGSFPQTAMI